MERPFSKLKLLEPEILCVGEGRFKAVREITLARRLQTQFL
jgi:hypothetical protein